MNVLVSLLVIVIVGYMIIKKFKAQTVLLCAGLLLMAVAYIGGYCSEFVPKQQSTGFIVLDMFEYIKRLTSSRLAGLGLTIMAVTGFAKYMDYIGASSALVKLAISPLKKLNAPYLIMSLCFLLCMAMSLVISSASGLAMLTMVTIFPILTRLGVSRLGAASVIATGHLLDVGPSTATTILIAQTADIPIMDYFVVYQLPIYATTGLFCATAHFFWQRYLDKKDMAAGKYVAEEVTVEVAEGKGGIAEPGPSAFALLPILPLILLFTFSSFGVRVFNYFGYQLGGSPDAKVELNVVTAMFISFTISMLCQFIRTRKLKETFNGITAFFKGMADQFVLTVSLIIAGETFAQGLKFIGAVDAVIDVSQKLGINMFLITLGFVAIIMFFCIVMGSGVATMFAFAPLVPNIAKGLGAPVISMLLVLQNAASLGRLLSPISAVNIAVCGISGISPMDLIKRNSVPIIIALISSTVTIFVRWY